MNIFSVLCFLILSACDAEIQNFLLADSPAFDSHSTFASRVGRRNSFMPSQSNRNYFRDLISHTEDLNGNTMEYNAIDPAFSSFLSSKQRKQSEIHGGTPYKSTREVWLPKQGRITGVVKEMHLQSRMKNVDQFLGVPYASPPVGSRRFMPPSSPLPWSDVKRANKLEAVCPQRLPSLHDPNVNINKGRYDQIKRLLPYLQKESEDCLYLNLYVTSYDPRKPTKDLPVIVFIHGESFEWNSGNAYDGSTLASYGQVIVITLNYRLGALGFLKPGLNDQTVVANFALLDQIAALQWVKENIEQFGGDRNSVTLMGHSTGAICANFLMISPVARGLFHRAILLSGSALSDWALNYNPQQITTQVAEQLNCPIEDSQLGECLRRKSYQEIMNVTVIAPEFQTIYGPIVDGIVILAGLGRSLPSDPHQMDNDMVGRFDLLFGLTEIESFNILGHEASQTGMPQVDRDHVIRRYLMNRYDKRPEIAFLSTLKEYTNTFLKHKPVSNLDHRDMLLEILSDARVTAPMVQFGIHLSRVNENCFMFVWGHNSESGEHATTSQSVHGEDLPYIFGAPLTMGSNGPFQSYYSADERLLSEATMKYFSNFAKFGKPTFLWSGRFNNMNPIDWEKYNVDWQEFNEINQNYLLLGIPPIVSQRYRHRYTKFWNEGLVETMKNSANQFGTYGKFLNTPATPRKPISSYPTGQVISMYPIKVEIESQDPVRKIHNQLYPPKISHRMETSTESTLPLPSNEQENSIFKSDTTMFFLISVIVAFLFVNLAGVLIYLHRRTKKLNRKYDNGIYEDDKRSKFNDTDEFILRKSNNTYESVKRHSPINGYGIARHMRTSTSTVDTNREKVIGWMSKENGQINHQNSFAMREKVSVAIDATPQARSNSILRQEPIEITKAKSSFDYSGKIVCQEVDMDMSMIDEIPFREFRERTESISSSTCSSCCEECAISHLHSCPDPSRDFFSQEEVTSFIESDVNVTCRDELHKTPLSPEESLKNIQRMNCPKVLPNYPENLQFNDSSKRRSLQIPPQYYQIHQNQRNRPEPPPRMSSTLGRKNSKLNSSGFFMTEPVKAEDPPDEPIPEITSSSLTVGPIIPKPENIYMSMQRKKSLSRQNSEVITNPRDMSRATDQHLYAEIIKNSRVQQPQDGIYSITTGSGSKQLQAATSIESNSSSSSEHSSTGTIKEL